jgi:hypothetical protein
MSVIYRLLPTFRLRPAALSPALEHPPSAQGAVVYTVGPLLYDNYGEAFGLVTYTTNFQVVANNALDPAATNVTQIMYYNGPIWYQLNGGAWYSKPYIAAPWTGPLSDPRIMSHVAGVSGAQATKLATSYIPGSGGAVTDLILAVGNDPYSAAFSAAFGVSGSPSAASLSLSVTRRSVLSAAETEQATSMRTRTCF